MPNLYFNAVMHQSTVLVTPPAAEVVSLADAKVQCRVDSDITVDDTLITSMIAAARIYCESYSKRAFITQTRLHNLDAFPFWRSFSTIGPPIVLTKPPIQSVVSVQYYDQSNTLQTLDPSLYLVDVASQPGRLVRTDLQPWPIPGFVPNAVQITAIHGYGDAESSVPAPIHQAILLHTAWQYRNRGDQDGTTEPPNAIHCLLDSVGYGGVW